MHGGRARAELGRFVPGLRGSGAAAAAAREMGGWVGAGGAGGLGAGRRRAVSRCDSALPPAFNASGSSSGVLLALSSRALSPLSFSSPAAFHTLFAAWGQAGALSARVWNHFQCSSKGSSGPAGGASDGYGLGRRAAGPNCRCTTASGALRVIRRLGRIIRMSDHAQAAAREFRSLLRFTILNMIYISILNMIYIFPF